MTSGSRGMFDLANEARKKVDEATSIIEEQVIKATTINMENLRPQITDKDAFNQLIAVINDATQKNYTSVELQGKITALGKNVMDTAVEVASIMKKVVL